MTLQLHKANVSKALAALGRVTGHAVAVDAMDLCAPVGLQLTGVTFTEARTVVKEMKSLLVALRPHDQAQVERLLDVVLEAIQYLPTGDSAISYARQLGEARVEHGGLGRARLRRGAEAVNVGLARCRAGGLGPAGAHECHGACWTVTLVRQRSARATWC